MENIAEKMNLVIDYIENHLAEVIEPNEVEKIACCSYYDVGRIFSLIADINISDYIRKRRLTLAGAELKYDNARVIDVALKYGYDSPVSFARAFQAFHGFNPSLAANNDAVLTVFPRLVYQICVKGVMDVMSKEKITINGKEYEASYFGEVDMSSWSCGCFKKKCWRLENAYDDFKDNPRSKYLLAYSSYPPINIEVGQIFVSDYYKLDGAVERKYYIADGTVWHDMPWTREFFIDCLKPIRTDKLTVNGKEYQASYFGEEDMTSWTEHSLKREFWRLENVNGAFEKCVMTGNVLPYNNYPHIKIDIGQVFVVDSHTRKGTIDRRYYIADGTVWQNMPSTREFIVDYLQPVRTDKMCVAGKEYKASYFGEQDISSWCKHSTMREFWRLENVNGAFEKCEMKGDVLPYNNYPPIKIEIGQVFVVDYHTRKGTIDRRYYIADGTIWDNMPSTREFIVSE